MQLINLSQKPMLSDTQSSRYKEDSVPDRTNSNTYIQAKALFDQSRDLLLKINPGKLLYSLRETASVLGVSYEYVRQKVQSGDVITKQFSSRKMVYLDELTKLIITGIPL